MEDATKVQSPFVGGDPASTGVWDHGTRAEGHLLVNPMENNVTANADYALAA